MRFRSLRWRILLPVAGLLLLIVVPGMYSLLRPETGDAATPLDGAAALLARAVENQAEAGLALARSVAGSPRLDDWLAGADPTSLEQWLAGLLADAGAESVLLERFSDGAVYGWPLARDFPPGSEGTWIGSGVVASRQPIMRDGSAVGWVVAAQPVTDLLHAADTSGTLELALYSAAGAPLGATFAAPDSPAPLRIDGVPYSVVLRPVFDGDAALAVFAPESYVAASMQSGQLGALLLALAAGGVLVALLPLAGSLARRVDQVTETVESLSAGQMTARTGMQPTDEIGRLGPAVDQYATYVQERADALRDDLRQGRRQITHLMAVLEALPDGVVVQDRDGLVILMNEQARALLGTQQPDAEADFQALTALVTDQLGPALAPGLYVLGGTHQIDLRGRVLSAQAAAVMSNAEQRIGTVILLRDITEAVRRDQAREALLRRVDTQVIAPLSAVTHRADGMGALHNLAREIDQSAASLRKLVVELRDLNMAPVEASERGQRAIPLESLVWSLANEWRQVAQTNQLTLHVLIERTGLHVLGNERRLRWAIGNVLDNAIKYTPPGGALALEIQDSMAQGQAHLRVRDNGVGIAPADMPHIFTRFYRGQPVTAGGRIIRAPGTGQGLTVAREIIEAHGGSLTLRSKQGVGTAVYISLPLTAEVSLPLPPLHEEQDGETLPIDPPRKSPGQQPGLR